LTLTEAFLGKEKPMPNWCHNTLRVEGSPEDLTRFKETVSSDEQQFDFNRIVPMPEDLDIPAEGAAEMAYEAFYGDPTEILAYSWVKARNIETVQELREHFASDPKAKQLADQYKANIDKHGHRHWYDWCCDKWGTKWNLDDETEVSEGPDSLSYTFATAWCPPLGIFKAMTEMFPSLTFSGNYIEHGCGFCGTFTGENGVFTDTDLNYETAAVFCAGPRTF
jgi:hypothetical protein